jgi:hypothetical protein
MNRKSALIAVAGLALSAMPAFAVSPDVEAYCFAQAEAVRPALTQPEKEAYIASCIADATATRGSKPKY